jgi:hypothetical protein
MHLFTSRRIYLHAFLDHLVANDIVSPLGWLGMEIL